MTLTGQIYGYGWGVFHVWSHIKEIRFASDLRFAIFLLCDIHPLKMISQDIVMGISFYSGSLSKTDMMDEISYQQRKLSWKSNSNNHKSIETEFLCAFYRLLL